VCASQQLLFVISSAWHPPIYFGPAVDWTTALLQQKHHYTHSSCRQATVRRSRHSEQRELSRNRPTDAALCTLRPQVDPHLTRFIAELKLRDAGSSEAMDIAPPEAEAPPPPPPPSQPDAAQRQASMSVAEPEPQVRVYNMLWPALCILLAYFALG